MIFMNPCEFKNVAGITKIYSSKNQADNVMRVISAKMKNPSEELLGFIEKNAKLENDVLELVSMKYPSGSIDLSINGEYIRLGQKTLPFFEQVGKLLKSLIEQPKIEQSGELGGRKFHCKLLMKEYFNEDLFNVEKIKQVAQGMLDDLNQQVIELIDM